MSATKSAHKPLPFEIESKHNIINVLKQRHTIPYHSRPFEWTREKYIEVSMKSIFDSWRACEQHWLGFIMIYSGDSIPAITDAQHRITLCWLMIHALSTLLGNDEALSWISQYGNTGILGTPVPPEDQEILDKYGWIRYPNIASCYEHDFEALGNILNGKERSSDSEVESRIYKAHETVKDILAETLKGRDEQLSLLRFIHNDIKVTQMIITNWEFTVNAFDALNTIKIPVPSSIILKNTLAKRVGAERSKEIHDVFTSLRSMFTNDEDYEKFIHIQVGLFMRKLIDRDVYERDIREILSKENLERIMPASACPFNEFCKSVTRAADARKRLESTPEYNMLRLIIKGHEVESLCLLPIAYVAGAEQYGEVQRLMEAIIAVGIRSTRIFSFNPLAMQGFLYKEIGDHLLGSKQTLTVTVDKTIAQLKVWLGEIGRNNECVKERIATEECQHKMFKRARGTLLYMASKDCHEMSLDHDAIHIDHIYPKTPGKSCVALTNPANRHRIGNLTPFVGKNSGTVVGNSGLGNKPFDKKVPEYAKSNIAMTREVATMYGTAGFMDAQIEERSHILAAQITALTAEVLGL